MVAEAVGFPKSRKLIFVIMPFTKSPTRDEEELREFFENEIKAPLESNDSFRHSYEVRRSGIDFNITSQIVRDLFDADLVICDLSGEAANPNVMFELGVRLASSDKPVILIRERHPDNRNIFDVQGLHTFPYNPRAYSGLRKHLEEKIKRFEDGSEQFRSPVLEVLGDEAKIHRVSRVRAANLLAMVEVGFTSHLRIFARLLNEYLGPRSEFRFDSNVFLLAGQIDAQYEHLNDMDWSEVRLAIGPHPAIAYYLSNRYLDGVVEQGLELRFSVAMLRFYEAHFGNLMGLIDFDLIRVRDFSRDASLLAAASNRMNIVLRSEEGESQHVDAVQELRMILDRIGV